MGILWEKKLNQFTTEIRIRFSEGFCIHDSERFLKRLQYFFQYLVTTFQ